MRTQKHECPRCHGLIVEMYSDVASPDDEGHDVIGWRCVNCGEYVDRLVLLNRWAQQGIPSPLLYVMRRAAVPHRSRPVTNRQRQAVA